MATTKITDSSSFINSFFHPEALPVTQGQTKPRVRTDVDMMLPRSQPAPVAPHVSGQRCGKNRGCDEDDDVPRSETPAGEKVYSSGDNLTSDDLKALLADVNDLDKCDRKHGDKALEALLDGDTKEARRQVKRMLGGDASKSEVDAMLTKLKKLSQVLSMSKDDLLASLRAGKPGAAPVSGKSVEREAQELDSLFGRADSDPNRPRRAKRKRGGRCGGCGCKKNKDKEATLRNALVKLKELEEASTSRELGGETPKKDLDGALADMGRPA